MRLRVWLTFLMHQNQSCFVSRLNWIKVVFDLEHQLSQLACDSTNSLQIFESQSDFSLSHDLQCSDLRWQLFVFGQRHNRASRAKLSISIAMEHKQQQYDSVASTPGTPKSSGTPQSSGMFMSAYHTDRAQKWFAGCSVNTFRLPLLVLLFTVYTIVIFFADIICPDGRCVSSPAIQQRLSLPKQCSTVIHRQPARSDTAVSRRGRWQSPDPKAIILRVHSSSIRFYSMNQGRGGGGFLWQLDQWHRL